MLLLTGLACVIGGGFVLVCLTTGLMTIAEFVEEHTVLTKRVLRWSIWGTVAVYILMWLLQVTLSVRWRPLCGMLIPVQGFPFLYILLGIICHGCFYALLPKFPFIEFTNLIFLAGVGTCFYPTRNINEDTVLHISNIFSGLSLLNHIAWFRYFAWNYVPLRELLTFFFLCVWLVPFSFFISLASNGTYILHLHQRRAFTTPLADSRIRVDPAWQRDVPAFSGSRAGTFLWLCCAISAEF